MINVIRCYDVLRLGEGKFLNIVCPLRDQQPCEIQLVIVIKCYVINLKLMCVKRAQTMKFHVKRTMIRIKKILVVRS